MNIKRKLAVVIVTLAVAFGAGHLVQSGGQRSGPGQRAAAPDAPRAITPLSGEAAPRPAAPAWQSPAPDPQQPGAQPGSLRSAASPASPAPGQPAAASPADPAPPQDSALAAALPAPPPPAPVILPEPPAAAMPAAFDPAASAAPADAPAGGAATGRATDPATGACPLRLDLRAAPGAMLDALVVAPCAGGARVVLRHAGLAVTAVTSPAGTAFVTLPALASEGEVSALLPGGATVSAAAPVDLAGVARVAVQWQGDDAFALNAYEGGARHGAPGHVRAGAPQGEGVLVRLGAGSVALPLFAEVYTMPRQALPVAITLEAAVTEATCGREILGELLESRDGRVTATELTLAMPGCDALGDVLVLNNLPVPATVAAAR